MKVSILTFGATRDIMQTDRMELELNDHAKVQDLRKQLEEKHPELERLNSLFVAVNEEYAEGDQTLNEGDVVALIPPVSGG